jgi:DNA-binding HxlR family transcriptional regulator
MHCSIARSFGAIGDPWKALIVRDLNLGLTRFDQLAEDLGVSRKVLTERLNEMVADELIERRAYQSNPPRSDYVLTERGRDLVPAVLTLMAWADRWLAGPSGPPAIVVHRDHECHAEVTCSTCGDVLDGHDISGAKGPGSRAGTGTRLIGRRLAHSSLTNTPPDLLEDTASPRPDQTARHHNY